MSSKSPKNKILLIRNTLVWLEAAGWFLELVSIWFRRLAFC